MFAIVNVGLTDVSELLDATGNRPNAALKYPLATTQKEAPAIPQATPIATEKPTEVEAQQWRTFEATAYIALCDTGCTGFTYTGIDVRNTIMYGGLRIIAVDPAYIALGSTVEVRLADGSTFEATAQDIGGGIDGAEIDVLMADIDDAWDFGRQAVQIRILKETVE